MKWRLSFNVCQNLIQWKVSPWHRNVSTFEEREISHQAININWVQCAVRGLVLNYPVEGSRTTLVERWELIGLLRKSNCVTGRICRMSVIRYVLCVWSAVIPSRATCPLGKLRSRSPMQVSNRCDLCNAPGHIGRVWPYRNKRFQCGLEGHFSRDCPQRDGYRDRDSVVDVPGPTPAEAAGRAATVAAALLHLCLVQMMLHSVLMLTP